MSARVKVFLTVLVIAATSWLAGLVVATQYVAESMMMLRPWTRRPRPWSCQPKRCRDAAAIQQPHAESGDTTPLSDAL